MWWNPLKEDGVKIASHSTITLSQEFYEEITNRPVPIDFRVLQALKRSPLQMDMYVWLTYRFSYLKKSTLINWKSLNDQFGSSYADSAQGLRDFKKQFLKSLHIVNAIYSEANIEIMEDGIVLHPSSSHIKSCTKKSDE